MNEISLGSIIFTNTENVSEKGNTAVVLYRYFNAEMLHIKPE